MSDLSSVGGARPKRSLGQNFLIDPNYQRKIIAAVQKDYKGQVILEIGPGRGALTRHLAGFARRLILVEKDLDLAQMLRQEFSGLEQVIVHHADILELDMDPLGLDGAIVVGNLPYNISTQILIRLCEKRQFFSRLFLMFQREVARRCAAKSGSKEYGILSLWCEHNAHVQKLFDVPPTAFRPRPDVVSTVLSFQMEPAPFTVRDRAFMDFVRLIFSQRRKKIANLIKKKYDLDLSKFTKDLQPVLAQRAEELDHDLIKVMFEIFHPL